MNRNYQKSNSSSRRRNLDMRGKQYFIPKTVSTGAITITTAGVLLVLVGFFLLMFGLSFFPFLLVLVGAVLSFSGIRNIYNVLKSNPDDQGYDAWLKKQVGLAIPRALRELNIQDNQVIDQMLCLHSVILPGSVLADDYSDVRLKQGQDGVWRSTLNLYTFFFPCNNFIAIYTRSINALEPRNFFDDKTEEYYYHDIVSTTVISFQDEIAIEGEAYPYRVLQFSLRLSNGDDVRLGGYLSATALNRVQGIPDMILPDPRFKQTLTDLRSLLRDKKW